MAETQRETMLYMCFEHEKMLDPALEARWQVAIKLPEMYLRHLGIELDDIDPRGPMIMSIAGGVVDAFNKASTCHG